jgi:hypothetical protein
MANDDAPKDGFGSSVAMSGDTAVVGAPGRNGSRGAAYVFVRNGATWLQQAELTAADGAASDAFGASVATSGGTVIVGAYQHAVGVHAKQGAAYVFVANGSSWSQQAELTASDGGAGAGFGLSLASVVGTAVVGAFLHTVGNQWEQGAAYVFAQSGATWTQQAELTASDGGNGRRIRRVHRAGQRHRGRWSASALGCGDAIRSRVRLRAERYHVEPAGGADAK